MTDPAYRPPPTWPESDEGPDVDAPDVWRGGDLPEPWEPLDPLEQWPGESLAGPEYWLNRRNICLDSPE